MFGFHGGQTMLPPFFPGIGLFIYNTFTPAYLLLTINSRPSKESLTKRFLNQWQHNTLKTK